MNVICGILLVAGLIFSAFISGMFESFIMKRCTSCGKIGPTRALCHLYSAMWHNRPVSIFGSNYKKPWGVIHDEHLCGHCFTDAFKAIYRMKYGESWPND